jgi:hypothetical protein
MTTCMQRESECIDTNVSLSLNGSQRSKLFFFCSRASEQLKKVKLNCKNYENVKVVMC